MRPFRIALFVLTFAGPLAVHAADGDIDTTFGNNGLALTGLVDQSGASVGCKPLVQPDGKIVICGTRVSNGSSGSDFFVARFNANGTLDTSFSFDGEVTIDFDGGTGSDLAQGVAVQTDGKIVVAGTTTGSVSGSADFAVARLNADGSLDTTFGGGTGKTTVGFDLDGGTGNDNAGAIALQADGKIVVAGSAQTTTGSVFAVTRLLPDGTRDSAFNLNGKATFGFGISGAANESDGATGVAIDDSGSVVVGGAASYNDGTNTITEFAVARLLSNGVLDSNFHANGRTTIAFDPGNGISAAQAFGLTVQRDGRIVLVGGANSSTSATPNDDMAVARLQPDGALDSGFGFGGRTQVAFDLSANGYDFAIGVAEQSNGRLVLAGLAVGAAEVGAVARLNGNGTLDAGFGTFGKQTYDFSTGSPDAQAFLGVAFQGTQIIVAGLVLVPGSSSTIDNVVLRLNNDLLFADGFE